MVINMKDKFIGFKQKRKRIAACAVVLSAVCFASFLIICHNTAQASSESTVSIAAGKNEEIVYGKLTSVIGNDVVCTVTDTQQTEEYRIPVGTDVTTKLGTVTTFAKLSAGNEVAIALQKGSDTVTAVWITK